MVLDRICGEAQQSLFVNFTDLLQEFVGVFIPDWWPMNFVEHSFNRIFDKVQEQMKPIAYRLGAAMGKQIESRVNAWIDSQFKDAMARIDKAKREALNEIAKADAQLREHTEKIANLAERVARLEGTSKEFELLKRRVV